MKKKPIVLLVALMCVACLGLAACSGSSGSDPSQPAASNSIDTADLTDGMWECTTAVNASDGTQHALNDVLNAFVISLNFSDDDCRIYVDTNFAIVEWELDGDTITLEGDGVYHLTVQDNGQKLLWKDFQGTGYNLEFAKSDS